MKAFKFGPYDSIEAEQQEHGILIRGSLALSDGEKFFEELQENGCDFLALDLAAHFGVLIVATTREKADLWRTELGLPLSHELPDKKVKYTVGYEGEPETILERVNRHLMLKGMKDILGEGEE
jgi:hypothetical protein